MIKAAESSRQHQSTPDLSHKPPPVMINFRADKQLRHEMKKAALDADTTLSDMLKEGFQLWLEKHHRP
ncbi:MAG: hypothetical protein ABI363_02800 [Nitrosospira sp.]